MDYNLHDANMYLSRIAIKFELRNKDLINVIIAT